MTTINIERTFLILSLNLIILFGKRVKCVEYNCTEVNCSSSEITCPSDSYYLKDVPEFINNYNNVIINDDDNFINDDICCITKKCACKLCHRPPSCNNKSLVLMEIVKETNIPGKCCGKYECKLEPNCSNIQTTNGYGWLIDCQRCECLAGQRICHKFCDEIRLPPANCIGQGNKIYSNGQTWKENECTFCECYNGEKKCQTSFCKSLSCPNKIKLPGECCAICIDESTTTTTTTTAPTFGTEISINTSSKISPEASDINNNKSTIETLKQFTLQSSQSPSQPSSPPPSIPPCIIGTTKDTSSISETYSVRTEYIESQATKEICYLYGIIVALSIILIVFITLYCYEKSKQRSYRPIVSLDDNCNNIIKAKIRKL